MTAKIEPGKAYPLGATPMDGGVNFSVYAHRAEAVELLLFDHADDAHRAQVYRLDPLLVHWQEADSHQHNENPGNPDRSKAEERERLQTGLLQLFADDQIGWSGDQCQHSTDHGRESQR